MGFEPSMCTIYQIYFYHEQNIEMVGLTQSYVLAPLRRGVYARPSCRYAFGYSLIADCLHHCGYYLKKSYSRCREAAFIHVNVFFFIFVIYPVPPATGRMGF